MTTLAKSEGMLLAVSKVSWLQTGKPWVQQTGSYPTCNRVVDGENPELEARPASSLAMQFIFTVKVFYTIYEPSPRRWVVPAVSWVLYLV